MTQINILDSSVFNRIAAGEVVENPRSVVKELTENAIDAGADSIQIEIRGGGIEYISVTDNGKGIGKDEMPIAFLPHATSKIRELKDLEAITTLGFRGEALPSIASVADVEMVSRTAGEEFGYKITLHGGKVTDEGECGAAYGTKITVRNLFGTVPARAKFLRKPQLEESAVTECVIKLILAKPNLKIKYICDGKLQYQSDGNGVESAVYSVYGNDFLSSMMPISYSMPDIEITGLICRPDFSKHNRTYQTLIVNGRYIVNADISYCIQQCYQEFLMKRQFPAYVLYLTVPPDMVDVNVHPNKLDVRFANEKRLKGIFYNAVKKMVDTAAVVPVAVSSVFTPVTSEETARHISEKSNDPAPSTLYAPSHNGNTMEESGIIRTRLNSFIHSLKEDSAPKDPALAATVELPFTQQKHQESLCLASDLPLRYAGKLFNTYILVESGNIFYVIDQHAAHEKLLYDTLVSQIESGSTAMQDLLVPYVFETSPTECALLEDSLPQINACGFHIVAQSTPKFAVMSLPACCADMNMKKFVSLLLTDIGERKTSVQFLKEQLMQAACKSAVKGEEDLSENEIDCLIRQLRQSGCTRFCPHGRPIILQYTKYDLEKIFKRIV